MYTHPHFKFRHSCAADDLEIIGQQGAQFFPIAFWREKEVAAGSLERGVYILS